MCCGSTRTMTLRSSEQLSNNDAKGVPSTNVWTTWKEGKYCQPTSNNTGWFLLNDCHQKRRVQISILQRHWSSAKQGPMSETKRCVAWKHLLQDPCSQNKKNRNWFGVDPSNSGHRFSIHYFASRINGVPPLEGITMTFELGDLASSFMAWICSYWSCLSLRLSLMMRW